MSRSGRRGKSRRTARRKAMRAAQAEKMASAAFGSGSSPDDSGAPLLGEPRTKQAGYCSYIVDALLHVVNVAGTGVPYTWMNAAGAAQMAKGLIGAVAILLTAGYASIRVNLTLNYRAMKKIPAILADMSKTFGRVSATGASADVVGYVSSMLVTVLGAIYVSVPGAGAQVEGIYEGFNVTLHGISGPDNTTTPIFFDVKDAEYGVDSVGTWLGSGPAWAYIVQNAVALFALSVIMIVHDSISKQFMKAEDFKAKAELEGAKAALDDLRSRVATADETELREIFSSVREFFGGEFKGLDSLETSITGAAASIGRIPLGEEPPSAASLAHRAVVGSASVVDAEATESGIIYTAETVEQLVTELKEDLGVAIPVTSPGYAALSAVGAWCYFNATTPGILVATENEKLGVIAKWLQMNGAGNEWIAAMFNLSNGLFCFVYGNEGITKIADSLATFISKRKLTNPVAITKALSLTYAILTLVPSLVQATEGGGRLTPEKAVGILGSSFGVNSAVTDIIAEQDVGFFLSCQRDGIMYATGLHHVASVFGYERARPSPLTRVQETLISLIEHIQGVVDSIPFDASMAPRQLDEALSGVKDSASYKMFTEAQDEYISSLSREPFRDL